MTANLTQPIEDVLFITDNNFNVRIFTPILPQTSNYFGGEAESIGHAIT